MSRYSTDFGDDDLLDEPLDPVEEMRAYLARKETPPMFLCFHVLNKIDELEREMRDFHNDKDDRSD